MTRLSLDALAAEFGRIADEIPHLERHGLAKAAEFAEAKAKAMFGN